MSMTFFTVLYKILLGLPYTVGFAFFSFVLGFFLGLFFAIRRYFYPGMLGVILKNFSSFIRGTPILFQCILSTFLVFFIFKINFIIITIFLILSINSACYLSEIFYSSFVSIPKIQYDSAEILNFSKLQTVKFIVLPQTLLNTKNLLINEQSSLIKETSILSFVGIMDIMFRAKSIINETYSLFLPIGIVGLLYYVLNIICEKYIGKKIFNICVFIINKTFL